ncbi:MAG TPA: aspartate-semialdehyde dehydrogenase [Burkholderiaceae bacterium]|jgi:aspartate-semialdehyde dehydrogenase|nr:aspartate-semialdehyde dehydrogenase [Burkholderiaceae bacterium]
MKVGIVGWRGMVGSVLMQRMSAEKDFELFDSVFFSTSNAGGEAPEVARGDRRLREASDLKALAACDTIVTAQGGDYTNSVFPKLRDSGWSGVWIDAASALRMSDNAIIILDPVNLPVIKDALARGVKNYIGSNCTVGLMLLALDGLLKADLIEWVTAMTYQAASGAGAPQMRELIEQMGQLHSSARELLADPASAILEIDHAVSMGLLSEQLPVRSIGAPLAGSVIPWIYDDRGDGVSGEERKAGAEANKILGRPPMGENGSLLVEGLCVRVGAMRCHSQALTIKLRADLPLPEIEKILASANEWVTVVPNNREDSIRELSPAKVTGTMSIPIGRLRKLAMGPEYLSAFTVGDQLLWGAAEPLRRMLRLLLNKL